MTTERPSFVPADVPDCRGRVAALRDDADAAGLVGNVGQVDALRSDVSSRGEAALRSQGAFDGLNE